MESQQPTDIVKKSDKKIIGIFIGVAVFILFALSGIAVGSYYLFKDKINNKVNSVVDAITREPTQSSELLKKPVESDVVVDNQPDTTTSNSKSKVEVIINDTEVVSSPATQKICFKYTIYEGPFKSSKCYTKDDYDALSYYLSKYRNAEFSKKSAESSIDFTCEKDYFKDSCDNAKKEKEQAESDIKKYSDELNAIISRGW